MNAFAASRESVTGSRHTGGGLRERASRQRLAIAAATTCDAADGCAGGCTSIAFRYRPAAARTAASSLSRATAASISRPCARRPGALKVATESQ